MRKSNARLILNPNGSLGRALKGGADWTGTIHPTPPAVFSIIDFSKAALIADFRQPCAMILPGGVEVMS